MTRSVETDFLLALVTDSDWLKDQAVEQVDDHDVVTSAYSYLELLLVGERYEFDRVTVVANLLDVVPVETEQERQIVLKAVDYVDDGLTAFDAFHAATAETRGHPILGSDTAYDDVDPERIPLEPDPDE